LRADVQVLTLCGDPDVRLVACQDRADVVVELLAELPEESPAEHWHAVRVDGQDRQVWRGPRRDAPTDQVVRFVAELTYDGAMVPYPRIG